jgi:hypothetical protein
MDRRTIATFKCHTNDSSTYSLFLEEGEYVYEQTWFNSAKPTDKKLERQSSLSFKTVAEPYIRVAKITLDTTKEYNHDVTDEQQEKVWGAIWDTKNYAEAIGVELNP